MKNQTTKHSNSSQNGTERQDDPYKATMTESQLKELFEEELKAIQASEKALSKAIPKMIANATSEELIIALIDHLDETRAQVERNARVFASSDTKLLAKKCDAMDGLIREGEDVMSSSEKGSMRDAGIISSAHKIGHHEMASYGILRQYAETLGLKEAERLLKKTFDEAKATDEKLSEVSVNAVNVERSREGA
jgi:ferritin-like metal-binding protein YciE